MNIFIDESGIHKKVDHSTFVVVYVEVKDYSDIEDQILQIEQELKIGSFHWSETVWNVKEKFIEKILQLDFKVKIALVKNPINPSSELERVLLHTIIEKKHQKYSY